MKANLSKEVPFKGTSFFSSRKTLALWLLNFTFLNLLLFWSVGLPYFSFFHIPPETTLTKTGIFFSYLFFLCAYVGHLALLLSLPLVLCLGFFIFFFPKRSYLSLLGSLLSTLLILLLLIDIYLYKTYHFHFNGLFLQFFLQGGLQEIIGLSSKEISTLFILFFSLFILEYWLARLCWKKITLHRWPYFSTCLAIPPTALLLSYYFFFSAASLYSSRNSKVATNSHILVIQAPILPLYHTLLAKLFPLLSLEEIARSGEGLFMQALQNTNPLQYPKHPLVFDSPSHLPNIVIIGLDAWRFDMMTPEVTPHIHAFSNRCLRFLNHFSGGNATEPGLFSLFYSIPSTYWSSVVVAEQSPLLIHEFIKQHYALGLFVSAETYNPPYNKTIFSEIKSMPTSTPGDEPYQRDAYITHAFERFIQNRDHTRPFFSFIFYNTSHSYCTKNDYPQLFLPSTDNCNRLLLFSKEFVADPFRNRYKNAVHYVDGLVGELLTTLEKEKLLDNTIVFILSDHGEEFNDNQQEHWGHASNFTRYQIQTPLLIYWPHQKPRTISYQTSHFDIVPTLFQRVLKCKNPTTDYSVGHDLFSSLQKPYLVVGSYIDFGIVEKDRITRILPGGNIEVFDDHHRPLHAKPSLGIMRQAFEDIQQFYAQ